MSGDAPAARWDGDDLVLQVRVQPRASRDDVVGMEGGGFKVRVTAAPVGGEANTRLVRLLAEAFGVPRSRIRIEAGASARLKRVRIQAPNRLPAGVPPAS